MIRTYGNHHPDQQHSSSEQRPKRCPRPLQQSPQTKRGDYRQANVHGVDVANSNRKVALHRGQQYTQTQRDRQQVNGTGALSKAHHCPQHRQNEKRNRSLNSQRHRQVIPPTTVSNLAQQKALVSSVVELNHSTNAFEQSRGRDQKSPAAQPMALKLANRKPVTCPNQQKHSGCSQHEGGRTCSDQLPQTRPT